MTLYVKQAGTTYPSFGIGLDGPVFNNNTGVLEAKNFANNAYVDFSAQNLNLYGTSVTFNAGATGSGSSWTYEISAPTTGQTNNLQVVLPSANPTAGQVPYVVSYASGVVTLGWQTIGGGSNQICTDTTTLAFGATSPVAMFTLPANAVVRRVEIVIDTPFNGTPSVSVGISGTTSKYMGSTDVDLTQSAGTIYAVEPGLAADASSEALIATYSAGSASAGSARILVDYVIPS